jgi:hypothetical protein
MRGARHRLGQGQLFVSARPLRDTRDNVARHRMSRGKCEPQPRHSPTEGSWSISPTIRIRDLEEDVIITRRALDLLCSKRNDAYEKALAALRADTQEWWAEMIECADDELDEGEEPYTADVEGLRRFIEREVMPWFENRRRDLANRPLVREQAFGESLDPDKLERLGRYEVHLDRKLERTLAMLIKLKELRSNRAAA